MVYSLWFRRYAPFAKFGFGFEGDSRTSASTSMRATARTAGGCSFGPGTVGPGFGSSSGSKHTSFATTATSKVTSSVKVATATLKAVRFTAQSAGSNPLVPGAPDIDTYVDIHAAFGPRSVTIEGTVRGDDFPNAEVFVVDGLGHSVLLWDFSTTGGQDTGPMTRLAGPHETNTLGSFSKTIATLPSGAFATASP